MLPTYLTAEDVELSASMTNGFRYLSWRIMTPGVLHRCQYDIAWIEVREGNTFKADPLRVSAQRRITKFSSRESFTDAARQKITDEIVTALTQPGEFDRVWSARHLESKKIGAGNARALAEKASKESEWWSAAAVVRDYYQDGVAEIEPMEPEEVKATTITVIDPSRDRPLRVHPVGKIIFMDTYDYQVGWILDDGTIVPIEYEI